MKEIEVKVQVEKLEPIIKKLEDFGCKISDPIIQDDIVYNKKDAGPESKNVLRIRKSGEKIIFTLKRSVTNELDCIEKEVLINDAEPMKGIIELLGYFETVRVSKKRRKGKLGDYEICLDEVEGLGSFIEIEKISDEDGEIVQKESLDFLSSLDVDVNNRVMNGYDTLLERKRSDMDIDFENMQNS